MQLTSNITSNFLKPDPSKYDTSTTINSSSTSIQSLEDEYRKSSIKWILQFDRKITKDTNYLAVWYLQILLKSGFHIKQSNWQLISASIILFSSKMNQIYPPSIISIIKRCKPNPLTLLPYTCTQLIQTQCLILNHLSFNIAIQSPYNLICQLLCEKKIQIQQCQKLLKIIIYNKNISQNYDAEMISYAIIYLISRATVDDQLKGEYRQKVKIVAQKMYNFYKDVRKGYEEQKEKEKEKEKEKNNNLNHNNVNNNNNTINNNNNNNDNDNNDNDNNSTSTPSLSKPTSSKSISIFNLANNLSSTKQNLYFPSSQSSTLIDKHSLLLKKSSSSSKTNQLSSLSSLSSFNRINSVNKISISISTKEKNILMDSMNILDEKVYLYS